jgi:hypothetical protein
LPGITGSWCHLSSELSQTANSLVHPALHSPQIRPIPSLNRFCSGRDTLFSRAHITVSAEESITMSLRTNLARKPSSTSTQKSTVTHLHSIQRKHLSIDDITLDEQLFSRADGLIV